jgi:hypothetical protein
MPQSMDSAGGLQLGVRPGLQPSFLLQEVGEPETPRPEPHTAPMPPSRLRCGARLMPGDDAVEARQGTGVHRPTGLLGLV